MRMIQRSHGARFTLESGAQILALGDVFRQDLDGDDAIEPGVARLIDFSHASRSDRGQDFVRTELSA